MKRHVYFVACPEAGLVKIGLASRPRLRLNQMQVGSPQALELVGAIPFGGKATEGALHEEFASDRNHGEWFSLSPALTRAIAERSRPLPEPERPARPRQDWPAIARHLRVLREQRGRSQRWCARRLGVAQQSYADMEAGRLRLRRRDLAALSIAYGLPLHESFPMFNDPVPAQ